MTADYRAVDDVDAPNYSDVVVSTKKTFVIEDGARKLSEP